MASSLLKIGYILSVMLLHSSSASAQGYNESSTSLPDCSPTIRTEFSTTVTQALTDTSTITSTAYETVTGSTQSQYVARGYVESYPTLYSTTPVLSSYPITTLISGYNSTIISSCVPVEESVTTMASTAFIRTTFLQTASVTSTVIRPPTAPTAAAPDNTGVSSNPETPPAVASGGGQGGPVGQTMSSSLPLFNAGGPAQPPLPPSGTSGLGEVPNAALDAGAVAALPSDSNAQDVPQAGATPIQTQSDGTQANSEGASPAVQPGAGDGNAAGTVSAPSNDQEAAASDDASDDSDETGIVPDDTSTSDDQPVESTGAAPHNTEATLETLLAAFAVVAFLQL